MLQKIDAGYRWDWQTGKEYYSFAYQGNKVVMLDDTGDGFDVWPLPDGVVLAQEVDAPAAPQICPICGGKGGHIEGHDGIMSGGGESVWVDCEACEGHGWVKPAPADPFMPSPEVRAALQAVFDTVVYTQQEYSEARRVLQSWVRGWPAE